METFWQDVRYGLRVLARNRGFTLGAIICLTLGIGATSCIFSVVNGVLLLPLPFAHPEQLVRVYTEFPTFAHNGRRVAASGPEFLDLRRDAHSWVSLDAYVTGGANLAGDVQPVRVTAAFISGGLLSSLGVSPVMGRVISPSEDTPNSSATFADISYGIWQNVFGRDPNVVGRDTILNGRKCTIIGVMPPGFEFPPGEADPAQVWTPLRINPANPGNRGGHNYSLLGRLKTGVTTAQAQAELESLVESYGERRSADSHSFIPGFHTLVSYPLQAEIVSRVRTALLVLLGAVVFVLLIACVNVASLLLARAEARRREIAIRSALGASTSRLVRQFFTESVLLSLLGASLGLGLAFGGLRLIQLSNAGELPRAAQIGIDWHVIVVTLTTSLATGVIFGVAPLLPLLFRSLTQSFNDTATSSTDGTGAQLFRRILVAGELALGLVLLIGCGLMVRSFWRLQEVHIGIDPANVITMRISLPLAAYPVDDQAAAFWVRFEAALGKLPGAEFGALALGLPPTRPPDANDTDIEGFVQKPGGPIANVDYYQAVSKDYFAVMGIRLVEGRLFDDHDVRGAPDSVIINQTMAQTFWPGESPIGHRIRPGQRDPWVTIVGVVEDVKNGGLDRAAGTELYLPLQQAHATNYRALYAVLKSRSDPRGLVGGVRRELSALDPHLPLSQIRLMDEVLMTAQSRPRFLTVLLSLFSGVALAIATVGIYGVISFAVERRRKEFGLRVALGAQPRQVLWLVMKQGAVVALAGVCVGLAAAFALTRLMGSLLFGITPTDPVTFVGVTLTLACVALLATYVPARRATKVDPIRSLRYE